jgi:hypothetical protein
MKLLARGSIGLLVGCIAAAGCAWMSPHVDVDPAVTFAAHTASRGLVIDKMDGGQAGVLEWSTTPSAGPQFVLYAAGVPAAGLWVRGADIVVKSAPPAAVIGQVDADWDERAIRLTFKPAGDGTFSTSVFKRIEGGKGPAALGQPASSLLDLRGIYQAEVVDAAGASAGWIRVRFAHSWSSAHRIYDGVLPAALNGPLAVAAAARLDAELSAVSRTAMDPYLGN